MKAFTYLILLYILLYACISTEMDVISLSYKITPTSRCKSEDDRFGFYKGFSIYECALECGLRSHCKTLNYVHVMGICELFGGEGEQSTGFRDGTCIRVNKTNIIFKEVCLLLIT